MTDSWDQGDLAEPPDDVTTLADYTAPGDPMDDDSAYWGRVRRSPLYLGPKPAESEWKGYKNGGKVYMGWSELLRRWGPVTVHHRDG